MDKVKIEKIVIRIGDKQSELTVEDAKALRDMLDQMFSKEKEYVPYYPTTWPWYVQPVTWTTVTSSEPYKGVVTVTCYNHNSGSCFQS